MMWIVRLALRRPYTFVVFALLILILGTYSIVTMPTDIFPNIDIPVVTVVWNYNGLSADEISKRIVTNSERSMTTTVNDIDHIESQSLTGGAIIKIFFQPHVNIGNAVAQVTSINQTLLSSLPPGTTPPFIIQYNASSVPVLQISLTGNGLSEQQLNDIGQNNIRTQFATIEGAQTPYPYGGKQRQIQVDIDIPALQSKGLSPVDVVSAISAENVILPSGTMKLGNYEYAVETNSAASVVEELNNLPIKSVNGAMIYIRDVAHVRDGNPPQTNILREDGHRATMLSILKTGSTSTLEIIAGVKEKMAQLRKTHRIPDNLEFNYLSDQSLFVSSAIEGVVREAIIAACLTALMILIFLGSWRSTLIIAVSIPLSILCSLSVLAILHETINIMTLGGMALAVGILVDDATVAIENINRNLESGKELEQSILDGAAEIATPALVSTLAICIVFVPMFFLTGVAHYLFVPMAEAVVFAMLASYLLSRTLVPTMAKYLLKEHTEEGTEKKLQSRNPFVRLQNAFEYGFASLRSAYIALLTICMNHSRAFLLLFFAFMVGSIVVLAPQLGQDFFPSADAGSFKIHVRAHTGTRIEETAALCDHIDATIRREIPQDEIVTIVDNVGLPYSRLNLSYSISAPVGTADADIQVQLSKDHKPTEEYVNRLRKVLSEEYPGVMFYVLPVDIVTQILNFGLSAPIDVQIIGPRVEENHALAARMMYDMRNVTGAMDIRVQQPFNEPMMRVNVDRTRAEQLGLSQRDVAGSVLVALSGSSQTTPTFFLDPKTGVSYNVAVQAQQYQVNSLDKLRSIPVTSANKTNATQQKTSGAPGAQQPVQFIGNLASLSPGTEMGIVSHYDVQPVIDLYANVDGTDLGTVTRGVEKVVDAHRKELPLGSVMVLRGQSETMNKSYFGLLAGLIFSILLVYLLIVVNFQSWLDPFLIISALPAALAGIVWFLFLTNTRLSVPALTGAIMCMGVATANSILVVSYAREQLEVLVGNARKAALNAGFVRLRPVMMTALAMIIGMVPMALGLGDGGEQNAPLGRAVIGGLFLATIATLFFVPVFFALIHGWLESKRRGIAHAAIAGGTLDEFDGFDANAE